MTEQEQGTHSPLRGGISLFQVGGIQIRLDPSWFLIFALILLSLSLGYFPNEHPGQATASYWLAGTLATLLFFGSILVHELSHAVVARRSGVRVPAITLFLFGGVSHMEEEARTPASELRIAAVGPLASFALAGLFWGVHALLPAGVPPLADAVIVYLAWINAALGVFNLLPGFPLDGGRVLRAVAWRRTGSLRRATRIAADAGKGLAVGLMVLGALQIFVGALLGGVWLILIGMFLRSMAEAGYRGLVLSQTLEDVRVGDVAVLDPVTVSPQLSIAGLVEDHLLRHGFRAYPVVEAGKLLGLISLADLQGLPAERRATTTVRERMRALDDAIRISPDTPLTDALAKLQAAPGGRLLVLRDDTLEGLLTKSALARFVEIRQALETGR